MGIKILKAVVVRGVKNLASPTQVCLASLIACDPVGFLKTRMWRMTLVNTEQ
ncbi:MAG: hypothetical protein JSV42_11195 [Chloroflexota bacterium]|nr:MAG: hypothetical protein JSV42_11195 [Chloroflexota bacterium]